MRKSLARQRHQNDVALLDADPELGNGLSPAEREAADAVLHVPVTGLAPGRWEPPDLGSSRAYGLLCLEGLIGRRIGVGRGVALVPLGPGDLLRPWQPMAFSLIESTGEWMVLEPARLAVLDECVAALAGTWPQLGLNLSGRLLHSCRGLSYMLAVSHMLRVEDRVLTMLWHLASSWGKMTPEGVKVPFGLTHATLGQMVGAQRPSVTAALSLLGRQGRLVRRNGCYILIGDPPDAETVSTVRVASA